MFQSIINVFIKVGIFSGILTVLYVLGVAINGVFPWSYLTIFFTLIRQMLLLMSWLIDTDTLLLLVGLSFGVRVAYWSYTMAMKVLHNFRPNN